MWSVPPLEITAEERAELERRMRPTSSPREAKRAQIILMAAEGVPSRRIAGVVGISEEYVAVWRRRFCERRLDGLKDAPRPGRPPVRPAVSGPRRK